MKTIQSLMTLVGLSVVVFALGTVGAKGQIVYPARFAGTFTLPFEAQWGTMTLPPGDYTLRYGTQGSAGQRLVNVQGTAKGSPQGMIQAVPGGGTSGTRNAIVCIRDGNALIVSALEMPAIGESVRFVLPRGAKFVANQRNHNGYAQLAEAPMLVQRILVTLNTK